MTQSCDQRRIWPGVTAGAASRTVLSFIFFVAVGGVICGCDRRPRRVAISGQVVIDGQPLTRGFIGFVPEGTRPSTGTIDENGKFVMRCYDESDGVIPGRHRVEVIANEILSATKIKWYAPKRYATYQTSEIIIEVDKARDDVVIELTWDGGKPFIERSGNVEDTGDE